MKKFILFSLIFISSVTNSTKAQVQLGVDMLCEMNFEPLQNKRVGLITNPTGVDSELVSTIDILTSSEAKQVGVKLVALFAPEHGVRGDIEAGKVVPSHRDPKTGAMVHSLYGNGMKPKPQMLEGIDILIFDIADIGSRSYTFISTLGLAIEAAGESGKEFMVLDRPNPTGGVKVEGGGVKDGFSSFVSKYNIPYLHGMTVGELAKLYVGEGLLKANPTKLTVIEMSGWQRGMSWEQTGLQWVAPSPHIPYPQTAIYYPVTGMAGELQTLNIGVGYLLPFHLFGADWIDDADAMSRRLNNLDIDGVLFRPIHYVPYYGSSKTKRVHGVQVHITDFDKAPITLIGFYVMEDIIKNYPTHNPIKLATPARIEMFDKVLGSSELRQKFQQAEYKMAPEIKAWWGEQHKWFLPIRAKYLLYQ